MAFKDLKSQVQQSFKNLQKHNLFYVEIDRDKIFQLYLDGFKEEEKQEFNCNCCKSFLRQYGGVVVIIGNKKVSIWDNVEAPEQFKKSIQLINAYIHSLPIYSTFFAEQVKCGTNKNLDIKGIQELVQVEQ